MYVKTINLPIYHLDIVIIINDWGEANKKFKLLLDDKLLLSESLVIDDNTDETQEIYHLVKSHNFDINTLCHELHHIIGAICKTKDIKLDVNNDEPIAYLQGYIGQEIYNIVEKYKKLEVANSKKGV